jgi:phosphoribosylanthranilate isomerase
MCAALIRLPSKFCGASIQPKLPGLADIESHVRRVLVVHVESRAALDMIPIYSPYVHAFLLDSGRPHMALPELGGTGRPHDWAISAEFVKASRLPVFLAGGLTPANVGVAIRQVKPFGVDLSSGVRTAGKLDLSKLAAFASSVRKADEAPLWVRKQSSRVMHDS